MTNPNPRPIPARMLITLATSQFVEAAAQRQGYILDAAISLEVADGTELWERIKQHFADNKKLEGAIAQIEENPLESALQQLETALEKALAQSKNQGFAQELSQLAQQLISPPPVRQPRRLRVKTDDTQHHVGAEHPSAAIKLSPAEVKEMRQEAQDLCSEGDGEIQSVASLPQKVQAARCRQALKCYRQALALQEEIGDRPGMAATLHKMGEAYRRQTQYVLARESYERSLELYRELGDRKAEAQVLAHQTEANAEHQRHLHPTSAWKTNVD